jgi:hypothetical protein
MRKAVCHDEYRIDLPLREPYKDNQDDYLGVTRGRYRVSPHCDDDDGVGGMASIQAGDQASNI